MTHQEILTKEFELSLLPMGPERWGGDLELRQSKADCPEYRHASQQMLFAEWMLALAAASKQMGIKWGSDAIRADYYEGQPEAWVDYYDAGDSPQGAINSDIECWD